MKIKLIKGDITQFQVDAIVNAANSSLLGGGGVDGAIHRAGGEQILKECKDIGRCNVGEAVITNAGNLRAKKVIHTVGPKWFEGDPKRDNQLRDCYVNSLNLAEQINLRTIAFPNISTGVYGFPKKEAAEIAIKAVKKYPAIILEEVLFVCFDSENFEIYNEILN